MDPPIDQKRKAKNFSSCHVQLERAVRRHIVDLEYIICPWSYCFTIRQTYILNDSDPTRQSRHLPWEVKPMGKNQNLLIPPCLSSHISIHHPLSTSSKFEAFSFGCVGTIYSASIYSHVFSGLDQKWRLAPVDKVFFGCSSIIHLQNNQTQSRSPIDDLFHISITTFASHHYQRHQFIAAEKASSSSSHHQTKSLSIWQTHPAGSCWGKLS